MTPDLFPHIGPAGQYNHQCECAPCLAEYVATYDAIATVYQAIRFGGDRLILGAVLWYLENRLTNKLPLEWLLDFHRKHGSTIQDAPCNLT